MIMIQYDYDYWKYSYKLIYSGMKDTNDTEQLVIIYEKTIVKIGIQ